MKSVHASLARRNLVPLLVLFFIIVGTSACSQQDNSKAIADMETRIAQMQGTVETLRARGTAEESANPSNAGRVTQTVLRGSGRVSVVPIAIETQGPSNGWMSYYITLALVNDTNRVFKWPTGDQGKTTIETQEGYRYEGSPVAFPQVPIPPGFRVRGSCGYELSYGDWDPHQPARLSFGVAATVHPTRAITKQFADIGVTHAISLQFPTERASTEFADPGVTLQIRNKGTVTFGEVSVGVEDPHNPRFLGVLVETRFKNSDPAYDTEVQGECYMFDGEGWIYRGLLDGYPGGGSTGNFRAGPGQETRGQIIVRLGEGLHYSDLKYPPKLENAKLFCSIEGTEVILNLPTLP